MQKHLSQRNLFSKSVVSTPIFKPRTMILSARDWMHAIKGFDPWMIRGLSAARDGRSALRCRPRSSDATGETRIRPINSVSKCGRHMAMPMQDAGARCRSVQLCSLGHQPPCRSDAALHRRFSVFWLLWQLTALNWASRCIDAGRALVKWAETTQRDVRMRSKRKGIGGWSLSSGWMSFSLSDSSDQRLRSVGASRRSPTETEAFHFRHSSTCGLWQRSVLGVKYSRRQHKYDELKGMDCQ
jgi:hypothetical protein